MILSNLRQALRNVYITAPIQCHNQHFLCEDGEDGRIKKTFFLFKESLCINVKVYNIIIIVYRL